MVYDPIIQEMVRQDLAKLISDGQLPLLSGTAEAIRATREQPKSSVSTVEGGGPEVSAAQALTSFLNDRRFRGCSGYTLNNYKSLFGRFLAPYEYVPTDHNIVRNFLAQFKNKETRRAYWLYLSAFYNYARGEYSIPNPMPKVPIPGKGKCLPQHLNPEQKSLLEEANLSTRDRAIIKLLSETALRPGEVADPNDHLLRFCDIFNDHLKISGKKGERIVPITPDLRNTLLSLRGDRPTDSPIFLSNNNQAYLCVGGLRKAVKRAFKVAGIRGVRASPYTLRHSFGADFLDRGGDLASLQKILGHRDIKTTMIYTHISDRQVIDAYQRTRAYNTL